MERGVKIQMSLTRKTKTTVTSTQLQAERAAKENATKLQYRADLLTRAAQAADNSKRKQETLMRFKVMQEQRVQKQAAESKYKELQNKADELSSKAKHAAVEQKYSQNVVLTLKQREHRQVMSLKANAWDNAASAAENAKELAEKADLAHKTRQKKANVLIRTLKHQAKVVKSTKLRNELLAKAANVQRNKLERNVKARKLVPSAQKHKRKGKR